MILSIEKLPGISEQEQVKLKSLGITTIKELLQKTNNPQKKIALASQLEINIRYVNKWVALADLARLPSVGCQYCGLLLHSGISSVLQLSQTPVDKIHRQMLRLQVSIMKRPDLCPPVDLVQKWTLEARVVLKKRENM